VVVMRFSWERELLASKASRRAVTVGMVLATYANKDGGGIWPSQERLARECRSKPDTVRRGLQELEELGFIAAKRRQEGQIRLTNEYRLMWPDGSRTNQYSTEESGTERGDKQLRGRPAQEEDQPILDHSAADASENGQEPEPSKPKRRTALPESWQPTEDHRKRAIASGVDVEREAEMFRLHAGTYDRRAANWNLAFTTWLTKAAERLPKPAKPSYVEDWEAAADRVLNPTY